MTRYRPGRPGGLSLSQSPVTWGIVAICVALYLASTADPNLRDEAAAWGYYIEVQGQWYRLFTSIFFHVDFIHIALNMLALVIIGRALEPALGHWRYLGLFLVSGVGGSVAWYLFVNPIYPAVGASGAIFGLFGAYFVLARRAAADTSGIVFLIGLNLVYGFIVPGIGWQDHIGGLVTGLVVAAGFGLARGRAPRERAVVDGLVLAVTGAGLGLLMLLPAGVATLG